MGADDNGLSYGAAGSMVMGWCIAVVGGQMRFEGCFVAILRLKPVCAQ